MNRLLIKSYILAFIFLLSFNTTLVKAAPGDLIWQKTYGGAGGDIARAGLSLKWF
jgi:hypothetical protein